MGKDDLKPSFSQRQGILRCRWLSTNFYSNLCPRGTITRHHLNVKQKCKTRYLAESVNTVLSVQAVLINPGLTGHKGKI